LYTTWRIRFDAFDAGDCSAAVFILFWIKERTKKITAVKPRADDDLCSAKMDQTRS
jgi:hypothetical protein